MRRNTTTPAALRAVSVVLDGVNTTVFMSEADFARTFGPATTPAVSQSAPKAAPKAGRHQKGARSHSSATRNYVPGELVERHDPQGREYLRVVPPANLPVGTEAFGYDSDKPNVNPHRYAVAKGKSGQRYWKIIGR